MRNFHYIVFLGILFGFIAHGPTEAEENQRIEGPALSRAVDQWLAKDNSRDALADIGRMASNGNLSAQQFARGVFNSRRTLGLEMSRKDLLELFPPQEGDAPARRFRPYADTAENTGGLAVTPDTQTEEWLRLANTLLSQGYRQTVLNNIIAAMHAQPQGVELIFELAAEHLTPSDIQVIDFWFFVMSEKARRQHPVYSQTIPASMVDADELLRRTDFYTALEQGVWSAVTIAGAFLQEDMPDDSRVQLMSRMQRTRDFRFPEEDMQALGLLLMNNFEHTPYLQPLFRYCSEVCQIDVDGCLAAGVLTSSYQSWGAIYFEPYVDARRFYSSVRASDEIRVRISDRLRSGLPHQYWELMPQCLADEIRTIK